MLVAGFVLLSVLLAAGLWVALGLRKFVAEESRKDEHLHDPLTPTLEYAVPNGVDPANFIGPLATAGFVSVADDVHGGQWLRIESDGSQRDRVRAVIEHSIASTYGEAARRSQLVVFEDERRASA